MRQAIYRVALLPLLLAVLLAYNASAQESAQMADCAKRAGTAIDGVSVERIAGECARNPDLPRCRLLGRRHTRAMSLQRVENYLQFNAPGLDGAPTSQQAWADAAQQKYDMFIDDYYSGHCAFDPADVHAFQDSRPPRGRLAIAYIDGGEFMRCCSNIDLAEQDGWFDANGNLTSAAPAWLGPQNPKFAGLYEARVWMPAWQHYILHEIDKIIALGYDGVFLDVLYNDEAWGPTGFAAGQAGIADYQQAIVDYAKVIWDHVKAGRRPDFIVLGNFSGARDDDTPAVTEGPKYSDGFMRESFYYQDGIPKMKFENGHEVVIPITDYFAQEYTVFLGTMAKLHRVVLMQDYNLTFAQESDMLGQSAIYNVLEFAAHKPINLIFDDRLASCRQGRGCWVLKPDTKDCLFFPHDPSFGQGEIPTPYCSVDFPPNSVGLPPGFEDADDPQ
jgi:endo-alpha-1,4-polygalactosaminidase (GH114 family)